MTLILEMHPKTVASGWFGVWQPGHWEWLSFPDIKHHNGANLSFADGHVDHCRWREPETMRWPARAGPWFPIV